MLHGIWLVVDLGQDILSTNIFAKFDDDPLKNIQVTERTRFILANFANSRAITPKCFKGSGWLSNLAEIFCQQTFSQSLIIMQSKLCYWADNCSGRLPAARAPIIRFVFSNWRIKRNDSCLKYSLQKEHTTISKQDFICIKITLHLSVLLQLIQLISAI